jgi:hypothetical protein
VRLSFRNIRPTHVHLVRIHPAASGRQRPRNSNLAPDAKPLLIVLAIAKRKIGRRSTSPNALQHKIASSEKSFRGDSSWGSKSPSEAMSQSSSRLDDYEHATESSPLEIHIFSPSSLSYFLESSLILQECYYTL